MCAHYRVWPPQLLSNCPLSKIYTTITRLVINKQFELTRQSNISNFGNLIALRFPRTLEEFGMATIIHSWFPNEWRPISESVRSRFSIVYTNTNQKIKPHPNRIIMIYQYFSAKSTPNQQRHY